MKTGGIRGVLVLMSILMAGYSTSGASDQGANSPQARAFEKQVAEVKVVIGEAASAGGEWRDTGKWLKGAQAAASAGDYRKAESLLEKARDEAYMGLAQAQAERARMNPVAKRSQPADASVVAAGKKLAYDRKKGNCLSCHMMDDGASPGNIGPPLVGMSQRFSSKESLRAQIWDATALNPQSLMPPFGRHRILSESDISKISDYVWTL